MFNWLKRMLNPASTQKLPRQNSAKEPYISPKRNMEAFQTQAKIFPSMQLDTRLLEPLEENGLLPGDVILLNWLNGKSSNSEFPRYFEYTYGINATSRLDFLSQQNLIETTSPSNSLKSLTVNELKILLKQHSLKVSGKKAELISRIHDNLLESDYADLVTPMFTATSAGSALLKKYSKLIWAHKNNSQDGIINVAEALSKTKNEMQQSYEYSRSDTGRTQQFLKELDDMKASRYRILGTLDAKTCAKCAQMDERVFSTSEIVPGKNFPPFHDGCRCDVTPYAPHLSDDQRWYRDPKTGKGQLGPYQTYETWKQSMIDKYGQDVFKH